MASIAGKTNQNYFGTNGGVVRSVACDRRCKFNLIMLKSGER